MKGSAKTMFKSKLKAIINRILALIQTEKKYTELYLPVTQPAQAVKNTLLNDSEKTLLKYLDGHQVGERLPNYFTYPPYNLDVEKCIKKFLDCGSLGYAPISYVLSRTTVANLKEIAKCHNVKVSGKKQDIINTLLSAIDSDTLKSNFSEQYYSITDKGKIELSLPAENATQHFIEEKCPHYQDMLTSVNKREFNALYQQLESAGVSPAINHSNYRSYHIFLDTDYQMIEQVGEISNKLKPHVLLCYIYGLRTETAKTVIDHGLNADIPFGVIHKLLRIIRATDDLLSSQKLARKTQDVINHTYIIYSCNDERCCDYCNQQDGMRYNVLDAVIGKNYPPFDDCTCEYCRCFVEFDFAVKP